MRRLIVPSLLILGLIAVVCWAQPPTTGGDPWWRPLTPFGQSSGVTAGTVLPTTDLRSGELALDMDAGAGGGPLLYLYDGPNAEWDLIGMDINGLTANTLIKVNAAATDTSDSLFSDDGTVITAAGPVQLPDGAVGAPTLSFTSETNTGLYTTGSNTLLAVDGVLEFTFADDSLTFNGTTGDIVFTDSLTISEAATASLLLNDINAAAAGVNVATITYDLAAMDDNADVARGLFIDSGDTGNHTAAATSPLEVALDIDGITGDAQANEYGIRIGAGWDAALAIDADGSTTTNNLTFGADDDVELYFDGTDMYFNVDNNAAQDYIFDVDVTGQLQIRWNTSAFIVFDYVATGVSGTFANIGNGITPFAMSDGDRVELLEVDIANPDHTGAQSTLVAIDVDPITGDPDAAEVGLFVGAGWDNPIVLNAADAQTADNPPADHVTLYIDESTDNSGAGGADCYLIARLSDGTELLIQQLVLNAGCP